MTKDIGIKSVQRDDRAAVVVAGKQNASSAREMCSEVVGCRCRCRSSDAEFSHFRSRFVPSLSRTLNLEGNSLERDGIMHLAQGLSYNSSLTSLNISSNSFGGDDKIPGEVDAIKYLALGFAGCKTLKT
ncbi:MAG: hypothetical protein Q7T57_08100, partial [Dehalococcoidales bacterium]|nr:hypothetical protein [Dehalococcoidales bacterium]